MSERRPDPIRVLIADDDHRVRDALSTLLSALAEFDVVGASATPADAVDLARRHQPTVALVDVRMPEPSDGLGLLRAVADLSIPAVAMSVDGALRTRALAAGAAGFLDKDSTADLLVAMLREAVARA